MGTQRIQTRVNGVATGTSGSFFVMGTDRAPEPRINHGSQEGFIHATAKNRDSVRDDGDTVSSRNNARFIQDRWTVRPNLTLNLGLRAEHERVPNFGAAGVENPIEFNYSEKLAPRLGFSYDPFSKTAARRFTVRGASISAKCAL